MKLVFIYGPPAAGKYTTGKELARITGFKFFHNHLTVPAVDALMLEDYEKRSDLLKNIRLMILTKAAEEGIDIIFTLAYSGEVDDESVEKIVKNVERYGGKVCFVQLHAPKEELLKRVDNKSRKKLSLLNKPTSKTHLLNLLKTRDHYASVKHSYLSIDTTKSPAKQSALEIAHHFKLI